jgi:hypothetical protein
MCGVVEVWQVSLPNPSYDHTDRVNARSRNSIHAAVRNTVCNCFSLVRIFWKTSKKPIYNSIWVKLRNYRRNCGGNPNSAIAHIHLSCDGIPPQVAVL